MEELMMEDLVMEDVVSLPERYRYRGDVMS